jgi:hypothetical protein
MLILRYCQREGSGEKRRKRRTYDDESWDDTSLPSSADPHAESTSAPPQYTQ